MKIGEAGDSLSLARVIGAMVVAGAALGTAMTARDEEKQREQQPERR